MKNRATDEPLLVIVFTLLPKEQVEKEGNKKDTKEEANGGEENDLD